MQFVYVRSLSAVRYLVCTKEGKSYMPKKFKIISQKYLELHLLFMSVSGLACGEGRGCVLFLLLPHGHSAVGTAAVTPPPRPPTPTVAMSIRPILSEGGSLSSSLYHPCRGSNNWSLLSAPCHPGERPHPATTDTVPPSGHSS